MAVLIPLKVYAVVADPHTGAHVVILKQEGRKRLLSIWIGPSEAQSIRLAMEKIVTSRPLTHELLDILLTHMKVRLTQVVINEVRNNVYHATLDLEPLPGRITKKNAFAEGTTDPARLQIDARSSDAITLALRADVPIYTTSAILKQNNNTAELAEWLSRINQANANASDSV